MLSYQWRVIRTDRNGRRGVLARATGERIAHQRARAWRLLTKNLPDVITLERQPIGEWEEVPINE